MYPTLKTCHLFEFFEKTELLSLRLTKTLMVDLGITKLLTSTWMDCYTLSDPEELGVKTLSIFLNHFSPDLRAQRIAY